MKIKRFANALNNVYQVVKKEKIILNVFSKQHLLLLVDIAKMAPHPCCKTSDAARDYYVRQYVFQLSWESYCEIILNHN